MTDVLSNIDNSVPIEIKRINGKWYSLIGYETQGFVGYGNTLNDSLINLVQIKTEQFIESK